MTIQIDRLVRSNRRSITIIVRTDGQVEVRAPLHLPEARIRGFVASHAEWVHARQAEALRNPPPPARKYENGEWLLYQGRQVPLQLVSAQRPLVAFDGTSLRLSRDAQSKARLALTNWYQKQAASIFPTRLRELAQQHGFSYKKVRISSARTRWGSCSAHGTVSISWRLVMAPAEILDYVLIHELVHTRIHNHGRGFWDEVERLLPGMRERRKWLLENGKTLSLD